MDRLGLTAAVTAALTAATLVAIGACGGAPSRVVARGTLAYAAAWQDERLVTVELAERFELVVRAGPALRVAARVDLGPPESDVEALAIAGSLAVVGGEAGWIRRFDLAATPPRELEPWPQGAPITALAADADHVAAGDATGAVCLRRATGELLQCATRAAAPIARLALATDRLTVVAGDRSEVLAVPALAPTDAAAARVIWRDGEVRWGGREVRWRGRVLARLGGVVRAVAASASGKLAIAGWVRDLQQASVVVWTGPPR
jgi:hypothetical protein